MARFAAALVAGTLLIIGVLVWLGLRYHGNAAWHFYEDRAGTYGSGVLLMTSAALAARIARRLAGRRVARFWLLAAAGFLFLAYDELTLVHESLDKWLHAQLAWRDDDPLTDRLDDAIVILYGVVALVLGFWYRDALLRLRWATLLLALAFGGFVVTAALDVLNTSKAAEESMKLLTEALIVAGVYAAGRDPALAEPP